MEREELQPLRASYRLAEYLKNHQGVCKSLQRSEVESSPPDINLDVDIVQQETYSNGAVMISVLTDEVSKVIWITFIEISVR